MNAVIALGIHGSLEEILKKAGGNAGKVSEVMEINRYCQSFGRVWLLSHDGKSMKGILPANCTHVAMKNRFLYMAFGWLALLFILARGKVSVIKIVGPSALPVLFVTGWVARSLIVMKYYYLWYNTAQGGLKRGFIMRLERLLLRPVDFVIACNSEVREFAQKSEVPRVSEGIITAAFDPDAVGTDEKVAAMKGVKAVFVGRLVQIKDPVTLLEGYRKAKKAVPGLKLVVCGDGPLMEECRKLADSDVHFMGFVGNVAQVMNSADVCVMTSTYDASPRSLLEAMCMGLPVVATSVGGIPEYMTAECGILVPPKNPAKLSEALVRLSRDASLRKSMGVRGRERVLSHYDLSKNLDAELSFVRKEAGLR